MTPFARTVWQQRISSTCQVEWVDWHIGHSDATVYARGQDPVEFRRLSMGERCELLAMLVDEYVSQAEREAGQAEFRKQNPELFR